MKNIGNLLLLIETWYWNFGIHKLRRFNIQQPVVSDPRIYQGTKLRFKVVCFKKVLEIAVAKPLMKFETHIHVGYQPRFITIKIKNAAKLVGF